MKVAKFGGTSLANAEQIKKVCDIVLSDSDRRVIVVSAPGKRDKDDTKVTDLLIACAEQHLSTGKATDELDAVVNRYKEIADDLNLGGEIISEIRSDLESRLKAEILDVLEEGNRLVRFIYEGVFEEILDKVGIMPLPPYITEKLEDAERYQTVYAKYNGSAAAPTAGLHFTQELITILEKKGVKIVYVMLHVGLGTFRPVKVEDITKHKMHSEYYSISQQTCDIINSAKEAGNKIVAVGTTSSRVLETVGRNGQLQACDGWTDIFIYPGYQFKIVDRLITNFHLPESTLIMLVSTLAGRENVLNAYSIAVKEKYRFFSFGDAMFIK